MLFFGDIEPNDKLKKAAERYKAIMTSSEAIETTQKPKRSRKKIDQVNPS